MTDNTSVLVVDDEESIADLYTMWLKREYDVMTAYNGKQALEKIDDTVDLVVLDRRMPEMAGDEVLAEIREQGLGCLVVLTTAVDPESDIIELDFDDYLTKPVRREQLEETLEDLLERTDYSPAKRQYHALLSKKEVLEAERTSTELRHSETYQELIESLEDVAEEAGITSPTADEDAA